MSASAAESAKSESPPKPVDPTGLDPLGKVHIPIGIANTVDTLKTFVEAEGGFSPGVGSYGVYFWVYLPDGGARREGRLTAPTMPGVACRHGLAEGGLLIPWSAWSAGTVAVKTEICHVLRGAPAGAAHVVGARVHLTNTGKAARAVGLYAAIRALGPAGWPVKRIAVSDTGDALLVDGHTALVSAARPSAAGVSARDTVGRFATAGDVPDRTDASSAEGDCSGALRIDLTLHPGRTQMLRFVCPVLPGRRAVGHQWDGVSKWAQLDLARPNPPEGGLLQPDPGPAWYRGLDVDKLFAQGRAYWRDLAGRSRVSLPDRRWGEALAAITAHAALSMNDGAPDVAVVNYNVFNRDGVYVTNILQKAGRLELAEAAIDYFLRHPFNGRVYPEADNPGQILWVMGRHWLFSGDRKWLERVWPAVRKIVRLIEYYRTTPPPHWVCSDSLAFGDGLPAGAKRQKLEPGRCDGKHPEYTEAFDVAALRAAVMLAEAMGKPSDAAAWGKLADWLFAEYDRRFGGRLTKGYGSYCVLWPCRLYPLAEGKAHEQFRNTGPKRPTGWRYFPLAAAHQGLLAGSRKAAWGTIESHLDHPQMRGWYAFGEGGRSGAGGWKHLRTTWDPSVAMPHGWAIAELHLLIRDALLYERGDRLVLLAGVKDEWLTGTEAMSVENMPTHFGRVSLTYTPARGRAVLELTGKAAPPGGFDLRLPEMPGLKVTAGSKALPRSAAGGHLIPPDAKRVRIAFIASKGP